MKRKYIEVNGQKYFSESKAEEEAPKEPEIKEEEVDEGALDEQAKAIAGAIAKEIVAKMDLQAKDVDSKIAKFLGGKDLKDKNALTAEEKIVGFYHALVMKDEATCKALSEGTAADGGYLFPDEFRAELIKNLVGPFSMRGLVRTIPMKRDVMKIPTLESRPKVFWTGENETKTTTSAHFNEATLTARKCAAILYASDELIEDSDEIDVVRVVIDLFADALRDEEDRVILAGNGTTQPTGLVTAVTATTIASVACAGNLDFDDIFALYYLLPQRYRQNAKFIVATANIRELRQLKDGNGRYLWQDSVKDGEPATLLGKPAYENDYVGEATILFGDYKLGYWLGDRKMMSVKISQDTETAFTKDQTAIRVVERIAGNVVLADAIRALITIP